MMKHIPYAKHDVDEKDILSVIEVLNSNYLTQGPKVELFEDKFSNYSGAKYSVAVTNGTAALHLACISLGITKGSKVWVSSVSFSASSNCAEYLGAQVTFLEIDKDTWNVDLDLLEKKLSLTKKNHLPDLVIVVHLCGSFVDMKKLNSLSKDYGFKVIEDACHSIGGEYFTDNPGRSRYSDLSTFSFHAAKNITTGEGGLITCNDQNIYKNIKLLRSHGITKEREEFYDSALSPIHYEMHELGYNYRLTDLQAALGISQLTKVKKFSKIRQQKVSTYQRNLSSLPISFQKILKGTISGNHLMVIRVEPSIRNNLMTHLLERNIGVNLHYIPIYRHPFYIERYGIQNKENFINSELYADSAITLPLFTSLSEEEQEYICYQIQSFYEGNA